MPRPALSPSPVIDPAGLAHLARVAAPALHLAPVDFVEEIAARLAEAGVQTAVRERNSARIYDWLVGLVALQGISDDVAFAWDARHGGARWHAVSAALAARPSCPRLRSYWDFAAGRGCGYRKGTGTCAEPSHLAHCALPRLPLRKGGLNQSAYHFALFTRDVCGGDLVGWLDARLAGADPGRGAPDRGAVLGIAVCEPLAAVTGIGRKLASMAMAELLLAGDPGRERWVAAGGGMIAIDSLVHNFLIRSGTLDRCGTEHAYGPACYAPGGCADILRALAEMVDARRFNPALPKVFPRWIQHSLWAFCAAGEGCLDQCNGNRIDDRAACRRSFCPAGPDCDHVPLRS